MSTKSSTQKVKLLQESTTFNLLSSGSEV